MSTDHPGPQRYDTTTILLHWLVAIIVLVLWVGASLLDWFPRGPVRADARSIHITLGLSLGVLGGGRLAWRMSWGKPLPPTEGGVLGALAKATHLGLYALLAAMVGVGILLAWTTGDSVFNQFGPPILDADSRALVDQLRGAHAVIGWLIVALVGLHVAAALFHQFKLRDGILGRMLP